MIFVENDVLVRRGWRENAVWNHVGDEIGTWRWAVTLLDVATYFLRSIRGFERTTRVYHIFASHRRSM